MKITVVAITFLLSLSTTDSPKFSTDWLPAMTKLDKAAQNGDATVVRATMAELLAITTSNAKEREMLDYASAYAAWRLFYLPGLEAKRKGTDRRRTASYRAALKANPRNAQAHTLPASLLGSGISLSPIRGMFLGRRSRQRSAMNRCDSSRLTRAF
jgi:hypothetical protein